MCRQRWLSAGIWGDCRAGSAQPSSSRSCGNRRTGAGSGQQLCRGCRRGWAAWRLQPASPEKPLKVTHSPDIKLIIKPVISPSPTPSARRRERPPPAVPGPLTFPLSAQCLSSHPSSHTLWGSVLLVLDNSCYEVTLWNPQVPELHKSGDSEEGNVLSVSSLVGNKEA